MSEKKDKFWILKIIALVGAFATLFTGCSLALDTQQDVSIPLKEGGFGLNANVSLERVGEAIVEYQE